MFQPVYVDIHIIAHNGNRISKALKSIRKTLVDFLIVCITLYVLGQLIEGVAISVRDRYY